jgi:hypothetical protein
MVTRVQRKTVHSKFQDVILPKNPKHFVDIDFAANFFEHSATGKGYKDDAPTSEAI